MLDHMQADAAWGFDLTDFGSNWPAFCDEMGLEDTGERDPASNGFIFRNAAGLQVVTGNHPGTGEYRDPKARGLEPGYASYMGADGPPIEVWRFVAAVHRHATYVKDESSGRRNYI